MDMVRSMRSNRKVPQFLWIEALKTKVYLLNRVPTRAISKINSKVGNQVCDIYTFGDARLKCKFITHKRIN